MRIVPAGFSRSSLKASKLSLDLRRSGGRTLSARVAASVGETLSVGPRQRGGRVSSSSLETGGLSADAKHELLRLPGKAASARDAGMQSRS